MLTASINPIGQSIVHVLDMYIMYLVDLLQTYYC